MLGEEPRGELGWGTSWGQLKDTKNPEEGMAPASLSAQG